MADNKPTLTDPTRQPAKVEFRHRELAATVAGTNEHLLLYLSRIAQALADIEHEARPRWIPVGDEKPEDGSPVPFVIVTEGKRTKGYGAHFTERRLWVDFTNGNQFHHDNEVTHWLRFDPWPPESP